MENMKLKKEKCLYEARKLPGVALLDLYYEFLNPDAYNCETSGAIVSSERGYSVGCSLRQDGVIRKAIHKIRDLPSTELRQLLEKWEQYSKGFTEVEAVIHIEDDTEELHQWDHQTWKQRSTSL